MKKKIAIVLFLMFSSIGVGQEQDAIDKYVGFEIYLIEKFEWNENSFMTNKKISEKFNEFLYPETIGQMPDSICHCFLDPNKITLRSEAFLSSSDIKFYSAKDYTIALTEGGIKKFSEIKISFTTPFAVVANNKTILIE